jgi:hypothetical protein
VWTNQWQQHSFAAAIIFYCGQNNHFIGFDLGTFSLRTDCANEKRQEMIFCYMKAIRSVVHLLGGHSQPGKKLKERVTAPGRARRGAQFGLTGKNRTL